MVFRKLLGGVFRKLQTPAAPHPGQSLLGAAVKNARNHAQAPDFWYNQF